MKTGRRIFGAVERILPDPLLLVDFDGTLLEANPAALKLCQLTAPEGSVTNCFLDEPQRTLDLIRQFSRSSEMTPGRLRLRCKASAEPIRLEGGLVSELSSPHAPAILLRLLPELPEGSRFQVLTEKVDHLNREIHARIRTEEALVAAQGQLEEYAQSLETMVEERTASLQESNQLLKEFTATMAHDLRAPLRSISGFSNILFEESEGLSDEARSMLERIRRNTLAMDRLIEGLLVYGRLSQAELPIEPLDPSVEIEKTLTLLKETNADSEAQMRLQGTGPRLLANSVILSQILNNLISNALKFSRPGVTPEVLVILAEEAEWGIITVQDNGIGIDPEEIATIIKPFDRGKLPPVVHGFGLGLAIVNKGIQRLQGRLKVESEKGVGSRFSVLLPKA